MGSPDAFTGPGGHEEGLRQSGTVGPASHGLHPAPVHAVVLASLHPLQQAKRVTIAYMWAIPLGLLGAHHFYLGRPRWGILYLFTLGLCGLGWMADLLRMSCLVGDTNSLLFMDASGNRHSNRKSVHDAYVLWIPPIGLLGFHHYYLGNLVWGVAYTFTLGLCGVGWLLDACRMHSLTKRANDRLNAPSTSPGCAVDELGAQSLSDAYVLAASPFGLLGAHQYYMERWLFGIMYTFTAGLLGVGWMGDMCTMPMQFKRAQDIKQGKIPEDQLFLDETYKLYFPLGFLGLHHFYLRRPGWGLLYLCTVGLCFVGWIIDAFRLPALVREANTIREEERRNLSEICGKMGQLPVGGGASAVRAWIQYPSTTHTTYRGHVSGTASYTSHQDGYHMPPPYSPPSVLGAIIETNETAESIQ